MTDDPLRTLQARVDGVGVLQARELHADDVPALQRLFDANPEYFLGAHGRPAKADEAQTEFDDLPPPSVPFTRRWVLGFFDERGELAGMASVFSDLFAEGVWHIGLFIMATPLHGRGAAGALYRGLEEWIRAGGAQWLRLGVTQGVAKAERFWEKAGFVEVRKRANAELEREGLMLRVMVKALAGGTMEEYLAHVARDRQ